MTKRKLNNLDAKDELLFHEVEELFAALRSVQESFNLLVEDGQLSRVEEKIIRRHFKGTVCE